MPAELGTPPADAVDDGGWVQYVINPDTGQVVWLPASSGLGIVVGPLVDVGILSALLEWFQEVF